ncbi:MAG: Fe-S cluster protein [Armatimonadetes bacterium]|nr:Fe-S cluster protein [Armatimonadota bacterium]
MSQPPARAHKGWGERAGAIDDEGPLIEKYSLRLYRPKCSPDAQYLSAFGLVSRDLSPVIPYLNSVIKGAVYASRVPSLTFYHEEHMMTVQPRQIGASKCADEDEARRLLDWLANLINETWAKRHEIKPSYEELPPLTVLHVYKSLPGLNCGECGQPTCMAFAAKLVPGDAKIEDCRPLLTDPKYAEKAQQLIVELAKRGYDVPDDYL